MPLPGFTHLNGNILAAIDVETTGRDPMRHEIIQIGIQPLDSQLEPLADVSPFYYNIKPDYPARAEASATRVHGLDLDELVLHAPDKWQVADYLDEWWGNLGLPHRKTLVPLAQNWQFEASFLKAWLGMDSFDQFFYWMARDTMLTAIYLNDVAYKKGNKVPFNRLGLTALCDKFGVINENPHDALADARAEAAVYRHLLEMEV